MSYPNKILYFHTLLHHQRSSDRSSQTTGGFTRTQRPEGCGTWDRSFAPKMPTSWAPKMAWKTGSQKKVVKIYKNRSSWFMFYFSPWDVDKAWVILWKQLEAGFLFWWSMLTPLFQLAQALRFLLPFQCSRWFCRWQGGMTQGGYPWPGSQIAICNIRLYDINLCFFSRDGPFVDL